MLLPSIGGAKRTSQRRVGEARGFVPVPPPGGFFVAKNGYQSKQIFFLFLLSHRSGRRAAALRVADPELCRDAHRPERVRELFPSSRSAAAQATLPRLGRSPSASVSRTLAARGTVPST